MLGIMCWRSLLLLAYCTHANADCLPVSQSVRLDPLEIAALLTEPCAIPSSHVHLGCNGAADGHVAWRSMLPSASAFRRALLVADRLSHLPLVFSVVCPVLPRLMAVTALTTRMRWCDPRCFDLGIRRLLCANDPGRSWYHGLIISTS